MIKNSISRPIGTGLGAAGDYHSGPINRHKKIGEPEANSRQLTLVDQEVLDELNGRLGINPKPGDLGENITISGLGDLGQLKKGDRLRLGKDVLIEITEQNKPYNVLSVYHRRIVKETKVGEEWSQ